jgi:HSP20 family molecular chaperone IbpA
LVTFKKKSSLKIKNFTKIKKMSNLEEEFTVVKNKRNVTNKKTFTNEISNLQRKIYSPKVDLISCSNLFKVRIELPGVLSDTIRVELKEQQIVLISGVRTSLISLDQETDKVIYSETKYGNFIRRVKLPELVEPFYFNKNEHVLVDGVLYLEFQKKTKPTFESINIHQAAETGDWSEMM